MSDLTHQKVGDYEIMEVLGDGAQGRVYKAKCLSDSNPNVAKNELVALKLLDVSSASQGHATLARRAELLNSLSHRNIVSMRPRGGRLWR